MRAFVALVASGRAAEYALLVALIAVVCIATLRVLGTNISAIFTQIATALGAA